jgi:hypothetical protein
MATRYFSLIVGVLYLVVGIMGFIPAFVMQPETAPALMVDVGVDTGYGYLLGLFPINVVHNIVHLVIGLLGIIAYLKVDSARTYAWGLAGLYGLLAVMGLIPYLNTTLGLVPIFGNDVWLHAGTALLAVYFGFIAAPSPAETISRGPDYGNVSQQQ